jgi:hypothetical protein
LGVMGILKKTNTALDFSLIHLNGF